MSETRKKMDDALKTIVVPKLRELGFKGSLPHFRRILDSEVHLITFQFDKYGGGFVIELAKTKNKEFQTYWGKKIKPNKFTAYDINNRTRIHPKGKLSTSTPESWFRYDKRILAGNIYTKVANQVLDQIELIEKHFS